MTNYITSTLKLKKGNFSVRLNDEGKYVLVFKTEDGLQKQTFNTPAAAYAACLKAERRYRERRASI